MKKSRSSGASLPRSISVGLSSRAAGRSCWTSGSVSTAKRSSRSRVSRCSSRKVGSATNASWRALVAGSGGREHRLGVRDQAAELSPALAERLEHLAGVAHELARGEPLAVEDAKQPVEVGGERPQVADRRREVGAAVTQRDRDVLLPGLERRPRRLVERTEDLVQLDGVRDLRPRQLAPLRQGVLRQRAGVLGARGELDVGLPQQRLLAQDRAGVVGDRRVPLIDLELGVGEPLVAELDRLDATDRDSGDSDVGLDRKLGRLVERDRHPIALGLQRGRAAEREPQEQQQPEAGDRERDRDQELNRCRRAGLHQQPPSASISSGVGSLVSSSRVS